MAHLPYLRSAVTYAFRLLLVLVTLFSGAALALDIQPYDAATFAHAQSGGRIVALEFHSGWCPICVLQDRTLRELRDGKELDGVTVFVVDFLKEAELRQRFGVTTFATVVVFRGAEEKARLTGEFQPDKLRQLFHKAL